MQLAAVLYLLSRAAPTHDVQVVFETQYLRGAGITVCHMQVDPASGSIAGAAGVHAWALGHHARAWMLCLARACSLAWRLGPASALAAFTQALRVGRELVQRRISHVHAVFTGSAPLAALVAARAFGTRVSLSVSSIEGLAPCDRGQLSLAVAAADAVVCHSVLLRDSLLRIVGLQYSHKVHVVPVGVDPQHYCPAGERRYQDVPAILSVGDLVPSNGHHLLIEAVARLRPRLGEVRLTIAGAGPDEQFLRELARDLDVAASVNITPIDADGGLLDLMRSARVYAHAGVSGELPLPLARAMSCGLPCVCSDLPATAEFLTDGVDGRLYMPGDVDSLVDTLEEVLESAYMGIRLGHAARYRIKQLYDRERNARRLVQALSPTASETQRREWPHLSVVQGMEKRASQQRSRAASSRGTASNRRRDGSGVRAQVHRASRR